jgi:hypothetical protein
VLLHGFPYDVHAFEAVTPADGGLPRHRPVAAGLRANSALRVAGHPAFRTAGRDGADLRALIEALLAAGSPGDRRLRLGRPRRLHRRWPHLVSGLLTCGGYQIQDIARAMPPRPSRRSSWYQYYFHSERGRAGLAGEPGGAVPVAVVAVVTGLGVRRRHLGAHGTVPGQPGLRADLDPLGIGIATGWSRAIRPMRTSNGNSRRDPRSRCPRSRWTAQATV